jgi:NADPH-dependent 2,4-dienoyl-CoA reductase/sulfur reductase-like enzyme/rhodanese-related sulfurtransferase
MEGRDREMIDDAVVVAHQMRSPLNTLHTMVRTLLGGFAGELTDEQKKILQSADRTCTNAMETVKGLLALADVSRGGPVTEVSDLCAALQAAQERYRDAAAARGVEMVFDCRRGRAFVRAEPASLQEAVAALIENAVNYTPEGGRVEVSLSLTDDDRIRLAVSDSGIGIPEDEAAELFRPFFRASNARLHQPSGTGLGLPFVKAVLEAAGGEIAAGRSSLGGAEFVALLPLSAAPQGAEGRAEQGGKEPSFRAVVIGGVAAGPKVASKIKRLDPEAEVTIVEKGRVLSYAGCGLPYYISGLVGDQSELISTAEGVQRGPEFFQRIKEVSVLNGTEAVRIDREAKRVFVRDLIAGDERWLPYDKLVVATGALPIVPSIPGTHLGGVYTLHGLEQAEGIKAQLADGHAKDVTIMGGGLIGVETTEALVSAGCRVTLVEMQPQLLPILDWEMAELVRRHFESKGVRVMLNTRVTGFEGDARVERVVTEHGSFPAEMVIMGVGVRPNVRLAQEAGLELGTTGAIKVDDHMRTSDPDVYAVGDCVETTHLISGLPCYVPLGSTANKQGRIAAINICGGDRAFPGVVGSTVCKVFDYTVARAGLTEKRARELGYRVETTLTPGPDRAHYMPDARLLVIKLICDVETRRIIGIQAVGPGEAAKRVDVAVTAMTTGMTIEDVANIDLCYAPSYSEALDNVHTACNVMQNKLDGHMRGITPMEVLRRINRGAPIELLDVRPHAEFEKRRIEGARHIPLAALLGRLSEVPTDREIVVFSRMSLSAYEASVKLRAHGFRDVKVMDGGMVMWPGDHVGE